MKGVNPVTASLHKSEVWILQLKARGMSVAEIEKITGLSRRTVTLAISYESEVGSIAQKRNIESGSKKLGQAIDMVAGAKAFADRYQDARKLSATCKNPIALNRPPSAVLRRWNNGRTPAHSREPCPCCATRGDLGCAHQSPYEEPAPA